MENDPTYQVDMFSQKHPGHCLEDGLPGQTDTWLITNHG